MNAPKDNTNFAAPAAAPAAAPQSAAPQPDRMARRRRTALLTIGGVVVIAAAVGAGYWSLVLNHFENTDNAYVQGNLVQITPQVGGTVLAIYADDTDHVKAGQPLVRLDAADAEVALDQAKAQLAQAVREVRGMFANNATLSAQISLRESEVARAKSDLARAQEDVDRRAPLVATGAVGKEEFDHANSQLAAARSVLASAQAAQLGANQQLGTNRTMTDGIDIAQHPNVLRAAARVREAWLALARAALPAPVDGVVAKRSVQVGQRVAAGAPLMTLVPMTDLWVDANFKEGQLRKLRIGQPAMLTADVYGSKVEYSGTVSGLGAGTGSAFSLLPAQNATGNWIKVVQRVPVRIALDPKQLAEHPLRLGLSMEVQVDVGRQDGKLLADGARTAPVAQTAVFDHLNADADAEVQRIVKANLGQPGKL
jgi:membrane fusion protein (multidrug efflux system)